MKLIELHANNQIYFINPVQITHAEGVDHGENVYISVTLTETTPSGASATLTFQGDAAGRLFDELRTVGVM